MKTSVNNIKKILDLIEKPIYVKKWSYSSLGLFKTCPLKWRLKYIEKLNPPFDSNKHFELGKLVHSHLEKEFYNNITPYKEYKVESSLVTPLEIVQYLRDLETFKNSDIFKDLKDKVENSTFHSTEFNINLNNLYQGNIDLYYENEKENRIGFIDYKTGRVSDLPYTQVNIYASIIIYNRDFINDDTLIHQAFVFVNHSKTKERVITVKDLEKEVIPYFANIAERSKTINTIDVDKMLPIRNDECRWCHEMYKSICDEVCKEICLK